MNSHQVWGLKAKGGDAFSIGVSKVFVVSNVDDGFLLQLGAARVVFVLHRLSDKRALRSGDRSEGSITRGNGGRSKQYRREEQRAEEQ